MPHRPRTRRRAGLLLAAATTVAAVVALATGALTTPVPARAVVFGTPVAASRFPTTAELLITASPTTREFCGGTLISSRWVLTAAHCLIDQRGRKFSTRAVKVAVGAESPSWSTAGIPVTRIEVHDRYDTTDRTETPLAFDVGLVELARAVSTRPMPLASAEPAVGTTVRYVGWGCTSLIRDLCTGPSEELRAGNTTVQRDSLCQLTGAQAFTALCTSRFGFLATVQAGDSGGPMLVSTTDGDRLAGIVSGGAPTSDITTSVAAVAPWIYRVSGVRPRG